MPFYDPPVVVTPTSNGDGNGPLVGFLIALLVVVVILFLFWGLMPFNQRTTVNLPPPQPAVTVVASPVSR